jgi:hypothetical protein
LYLFDTATSTNSYTEMMPAMSRFALSCALIHSNLLNELKIYAKFRDLFDSLLDGVCEQVGRFLAVTLML